ncbi:unnamed protein product [Brugia timori]|uniref:NADH dehydrogenase subunit 5 n=1 Tax=Brugia timori TaxID=42155 RepID=A0A3P7VE14_9BILA|nr:unnamed protein product [Brugia timori]
MVFLFLMSLLIFIFKLFALENNRSYFSIFDSWKSVILIISLLVLFYCFNYSLIVCIDEQWMILFYYFVIHFSFFKLVFCWSLTFLQVLKA